MKDITPEYLFEQIVGTTGLTSDDDDGDVISISKDHLLLIAFAGTNAILNMLMDKNIISKDELVGYVGGSIKGITDMFDFNLEKEQ